MSNPEIVKVAAVCGSLRQGSYNHGLLRALSDIADERGTISLTMVEGLGDMPFINVDLLRDGLPATVQQVQDQVAKADAVIVATPEFSYSLPPVLKNFFDWQALPDPPSTPLRHKPFGIVGASIGHMGTYRAQCDVRKIALFADAEVMGRPEVYVSYCEDKFNEDGELADVKTRQLLERFLDDFEEFTRSTLARDLAAYNRAYLRA